MHALALFRASGTTLREKETLAGVAKEREKKLPISFLRHMLHAFVSLATSEHTYGTQAVNLQDSQVPAPELVGNTRFKLRGLMPLV